MQGIDGPEQAEIISRQLYLSSRPDIGLGPGIPQRLGVLMDVSTLPGGMVHAN